MGECGKVGALWANLAREESTVRIVATVFTAGVLLSRLAKVVEPKARNHILIESAINMNVRLQAALVQVSTVVATRPEWTTPPEVWVG